MKKAKFWLVQIAMVAIVSLVFGSPVFAGLPDHAKGKGAETSSNSHSNHSGGKAQAEDHANENAAFMAASTGGGTDDTADCAEEEKIKVATGEFDVDGPVFTWECP